MVEPVCELRLDELLEVRVLERAPHLLVAELVERVQVEPERAREQHRVLRDDGQLLAEVVQADAEEGQEGKAGVKDDFKNLIFLVIYKIFTHSSSNLIRTLDVRNSKKGTPSIRISQFRPMLRKETFFSQIIASLPFYVRNTRYSTVSQTNVVSPSFEDSLLDFLY